MTNQEKAAIVLMTLDEEVAARIVRNLGPDEIKTLGLHMNRLGNVTSEEIQRAAGDFCMLAKEYGKTGISFGGGNIRSILVKAVGEERAAKVMQGIQNETFKPSVNPIIEKLRDIEPQIILDFTKAEHPQTIALILAHLRPEQTANILENLSDKVRIDVVRRMATLQSVPHDFIDDMAKTLESELITGSTSEQHFGGADMVADILNKMNRASESAILELLDESHPDLATDIRNLMFTFDDMFDLDDRSMREILQQIDGDDLTRALKVVDEDRRELFFSNMSKRGAEMLKDDIDIMPPTRLSEVEESQRKIIEVVKRLEGEGKIQISRGDEGDTFV